MIDGALADRLAVALEPRANDLILVVNAAEGLILTAIAERYAVPPNFLGLKVPHWAESNAEMRSFLLTTGFKEAPRVGRTFIEEFPTDQDYRYNGVLVGLPRDYSTITELRRISHDIGYLRRAYDWLAPHGRVVGYCTEEAFTSRDSTAVGWRWWLSEQQAETEPLDEPILGIKARLVIIDK